LERSKERLMEMIKRYQVNSLGWHFRSTTTLTVHEVGGNRPGRLRQKKNRRVFYSTNKRVACVRVLVRGSEFFPRWKKREETNKTGGGGRGKRKR